MLEWQARLEDVLVGGCRTQTLLQKVEMASIDRLLPDDELVQLDEVDVGRDDLEGVTEDRIREHALSQSLEMPRHRFDARVVRDPGRPTGLDTQMTDRQHLG